MGQRLNELLREYEITIRREKGQVAMVKPDGDGNLAAEESGACVYRISLGKGGVTLQYAGADQPEVVVPEMALRLLTALEQQKTPGEKSNGLEAFEAAVEAAVLERQVSGVEFTEEEDR
jgi:hypothetical protein